MDCKKLLKVISYFSSLENVDENIKSYTIEALQSQIDKMSSDEIDNLMNLLFNSTEMSKLSNDILNRKWPVEENELSIFNFIFEYNHFLRIYFFFEQNQPNEDYQAKELKIISLLESTLKQLTDGCVQIGLLKILNDKKTILIDLFELFSQRINSKPWDTDDRIEQVTNKIFAFRMKEVENYAKFHSSMTKFLNFMHGQSYFKKSIFILIFILKLPRFTFVINLY